MGTTKNVMRAKEKVKYFSFNPQPTDCRTVWPVHLVSNKIRSAGKHAGNISSMAMLTIGHRFRLPRKSAFNFVVSSFFYVYSLHSISGYTEAIHQATPFTRCYKGSLLTWLCPVIFFFRSFFKGSSHIQLQQERIASVASF